MYGRPATQNSFRQRLATVFVWQTVLLSATLFLACSGANPDGGRNPLLLGTWETKNITSGTVIKTLVIAETTIVLSSFIQSVQVECAAHYSYTADATTISQTQTSAVECDNGTSFDSGIGQEAAWQYEVDETYLTLVDLETSAYGEYVRIE